MFCNNCGFVNAGNETLCTTCGHDLHAEPHLSDITYGNTAICEVCGSMNLDDSNYCRSCGKKLKNVIVQTLAGAASMAGAYSEIPMNVVITPTGTDFTSFGGLPPLAEESKKPLYDETLPSPAEFIPQIQVRHESLLERLDKMERELETRQKEILPETNETTPDELDAHEETLKNIAYTLDSLISDLLEAEVREYAFPDFIHPDETGFPMNDAAPPPKQNVKSDKKGRNLQEYLVIMALIAAIFLVGLSFGLWGSYFFGI
ncbi:MAG: zinc ribbon domain-containing protein [Synergistaceae bacterium]|nr:zinc ribbon domain-containing protein [Synergistaceae bacterium]